MNRRESVVCPYCGRTNYIEVVNDRGQMTPVQCDFMDGGCDKWFIARTEVIVKIRGLKIEGEDGEEG